MSQSLLEQIARDMIDKIRHEVADAAEAMTLKRCSELKITEPESPEAIHMYETTERILVAAVLRHMTGINNHETAS